MFVLVACNNKKIDKSKDTELLKTEINGNKSTQNIENYVCDLTELTEKNGEKIVYSTCDGGNTELSIYKYRDTFFLLLYGGQEDDLFVINECYKTISDTIFFNVNYYGDNYYSSNVKNESGIIKFVLTDSLKGTSDWFFTYLDVSYNKNFVSKEKQKLFVEIKEPCINCFEKEECDEFEKKELLISNLSPLEQISKLLENYKKGDKRFNYRNSKQFIKLLKKNKKCR